MNQGTAPEDRGGSAWDERSRRQFAHRLPKAEIHLHLEGSVELDTLVALVRRHGEPAGPEVLRRLAGLYTQRDFLDFLSHFRSLCAEIRGPEDFALMATELSHRLQNQNVRYAEVFCSPVIFHRALGLPATEILDAVSQAARARERDGGPRLRFLLDGVRQFGVAGMEQVVADASSCRGYDVIGIGMGGDETALPTSEFHGPYAEARRLGLRTTVHAGEFDGPRSVWQAIETLEVERIGHGVRAAEDRELVRHLRRTGRPLECCPTSNILTGAASGWESHPMKELHQQGVFVTVNSDDPAMFSTSLVGEWESLMTRLGLSLQEVLDVGVRTALATFLPEAERQALASDMRRAALEFGVGA